MPNISHIEIDSLSKEDTNALFNRMCQKIANLTPLQGRVQILGLSGPEKNVSAHIATIADVITFISTYDVPVKLRVEYLSKPDKAVTGKEDYNPTKGYKNDPVYDAMKDQSKDITNPDLLSSIQPVQAEDYVKKKEEKGFSGSSVPYSKDDLPF